MEHTLRGSFIYRISRTYRSLNPCCNGTYSPSHLLLMQKMVQSCLNPCCNGTYSPRNYYNYGKNHSFNVLILVVMEHTLRGTRVHPQNYFFAVLILVVMEHTLRGTRVHPQNYFFAVLILVVMEHTLRESNSTS